MLHTSLGPLDGVSRLTLGGGGLGRIWGETSIDEAVATVHAAVDAGITLIDTAPMYRDCEAVIAQAFAGRPPPDVRFTTKHQLGAPPAGEVARRLEASLDASLAAMRLERADIFFLHSNIRPDDYAYARHDERKDRFATPWSQYVGEVVPAMEALKARGRIGAWGITGVGVPAAILDALAHDPAPAVVQAIANLLDSAGGMRNYAEAARPREIIAAANARGIGVMGIRAVQAGALTAAIDRELSPNHPEAEDFVRAAPFRALCAELGADPAVIAHRYALGMAGVDTVVLGVKNRAELAGCIAAEAEAQGPLPADLVRRIDALMLLTA
jgi:aryl-alcohol dehydrogenase-like predicted oxidoreductase